MQKHTRITDEDEQEVYVAFQKEQILRTQSSEVIVNTLFHIGNWAYLPLMDLIENGQLKHLPILFLFGDDDWMYRNMPNDEDTLNAKVPLPDESKCYFETIIAADEEYLNSKGMKRSDLFHEKSCMEFVEGAGHQLIVDNAIGTNHWILKFLSGGEIADEYAKENP